VPDGAPVGSQAGSAKYHIGYYQWVPVMLLVQAVLFYIPCLLWRVFSERSGININNLVEAADTIQNALYPERRDKTIKYVFRVWHYTVRYGTAVCCPRGGGLGGRYLDSGGYSCDVSGHCAVE